MSESRCIYECAVTPPSMSAHAHSYEIVAVGTATIVRCCMGCGATALLTCDQLTHRWRSTWVTISELEDNDESH